MTMELRRWIAAVGLLFFAGPVLAQDGSGQHQHEHHAESAATPVPVDSTMVGIDENLGQQLPLDLKLRDSEGVERTLKEFVGGQPLVLSLIFYSCHTACSMIQANMGAALQGIERKGESVQALTLSFDHEDDVAAAARAKGSYLLTAGKDFPADQWRFAVSDKETIRQVLSAVGFRVYQRGKHDFAHPNAIVVISPEGKVIRYLHGTTFLVSDVRLALSEALRESPGVSIRKLVSYCFTYDDESKRYRFRVVQVGGVGILLGIVAIALFILPGRNKTRRTL